MNELRPAPAPEGAVPPRRWPRWALALAVLLAAGIAAYEMVASPFQALLLAGYGKRLTFEDGDGPSPRIRFPGTGPYDERLGYTRLPEFSERLQQRGFTIRRQARISEDMARLGGLDIFLPYREKSVAGLRLLDCHGATLYHQPLPRRAYAAFGAIPPVIANTLLYIENRELLDPNHPQRNPAIEWNRFAQALLEKMIQVVQPGRNVPGGSTLATQIEKYRHSPDGLTMTGGDKLAQMASASLRAYLEGADTRVSRRRIVQDYLNTVPLSAAPGHGEVIGLADALEAWFDLDFDTVNRLLRGPEVSPAAARAYKHVLALLIAQRKPSGYLIGARAQLEEQVNTHLRLLAKAGVITAEIRDLALHEKIVFRSTAARPAASFIDNKAANALRVEIARLLGMPGLYEVDRLDLNAATTLHAGVQQAVTRHLKRLDDPLALEGFGLYGRYLLDRSDDLSRIIWSFTFYELTPNGAAVRVQADNLNQPFDINAGAKLDMGSSAKLRTLITYLQIIADLYRQYGAKPADELARERAAEHDALTAWVLDYLRGGGARSLPAILDAAMGRRYSASPSEGFFTGGGLHYFHNFHREDDGKVMDLREATRNSVNLPFIRLMRDIIRHFTYRVPSPAAAILADAGDPRRETYLLKFADNEGRAFLGRFFRKYHGLPPEQIEAGLLNHLAAHPRRLAAVYRYLRPEAAPAAFAALMRGRLTNPGRLDAAEFARLYEVYGPDRFSLSDRGYIAQIHPLELWLAGYLLKHPQAKWDELVRESAAERVRIYDWLFKVKRKDAQDSRIQSLLEIEAFQELHRRWRVLGYPFNSLVPSYATAIGSSADRPAALAELMGVIRNNGARLPPVSLTRLDFAVDTPYHTLFARNPPQAEQVFDPVIAATVRAALSGVVEEGTARRLRGAFAGADGVALPIGGKTGTGDHRFEIYGAGGKVIESRVMNRVATFAFFLGARHYGVITAFVPGEAAADYHFTSALPVQLLKSMAPLLRPLVLPPDQSDPPWSELVKTFDAENPPRVTRAAPAPVKLKPVPVKPEPAKPTAKPAPAKPLPARPEVPRHEPKPEPKHEPAKPEKRSNPWVAPEYQFLF